MSEEEYIRNRLDMINRNSHYGLMIDTEITKIVRDHIKRLEDNKMKPTSVWKIENIDNIWITQDGDEISLLLKNRDDLTKITLTGDVIKNHNDNFITTLKVDMEEIAKAMCEKDQKIRGLEEKIKQLERDNAFDKETADYWSNEYNTLSEKFAKLQEEKDQRIRELEAKSKDISDDNALLLETNKKLKKELHSLKNLKKSNLPETPITDTMLVDNYNRLVEENKQLKQENGELKYLLNDIKFTKDITEMCLNTRAGILDQAKKCVCGQREQDYGTPESNFQLIADLWNDYLGITDYVLELEERFMDLNDKGIKVDVDIPKPKTIFPEDVAMMMALLKIARIRNGGGSGDSFVDLAGYAACGGEIWYGKTQISKG